MDWMTLWEGFKTVWTFLLTTGTNDGFIAFFLKNILLISLVIWMTPGKWDDKLITKVKDLISNFKKKGEDTDEVTSESVSDSGNQS